LASNSPRLQSKMLKKQEPSPSFASPGLTGKRAHPEFRKEGCVGPGDLLGYSSRSVFAVSLQSVGVEQERLVDLPPQFQGHMKAVTSLTHLWFASRIINRCHCVFPSEFRRPHFL
jgi:hypothetical protein